MNVTVVSFSLFLFSLCVRVHVCACAGWLQRCKSWYLHCLPKDTCRSGTRLIWQSWIKTLVSENNYRRHPNSPAAQLADLTAASEFRHLKVLKSIGVSIRLETGIGTVDFYCVKLCSLMPDRVVCVMSHKILIHQQFPDRRERINRKRENIQWCFKWRKKCLIGLKRMTPDHLVW